jgi:hypothetical protein
VDILAILSTWGGQLRVAGCVWFGARAVPEGVAQINAWDSQKKQVNSQIKG